MSEKIGRQLLQAREARSLSLEEAAHATRIKPYYLQAIESGDFSGLPSPAQGRGFIRTYANFLGLDPQVLLADLPEKTAPPPVTPLPQARSAPEPEISTDQADAIFIEIGRTLRHQREILGLSLEDVEKHTHLRLHYLKALEAGDLSAMPSPVQGRGMLHNYGEFLGLDPEPLLLRFAEGLQARLAAKQATRPLPRTVKARRAPDKISPFRRFLSLDFVLGGILIGLLTAFVVWGVMRISNIRSQASALTSTPTAPSIAEVLLFTPTTSQISPFTPVGTPGTNIVPGPSVAGDTPAPETLTTQIATAGVGDQTPAITLPVVENATLQVSIVVRQNAWLKVTVDDKVVFQGRVAPGSVYSYGGDTRVELLTGNGAALQVFFNQADLGVLGSLGEVVQRIFTVEGVQTPTATITPTARPTLTPTPSATATRSP